MLHSSLPSAALAGVMWRSLGQQVTMWGEWGLHVVKGEWELKPGVNRLSWVSANSRPSAGLLFNAGSLTLSGLKTGGPYTARMAEMDFVGLSLLWEMDWGMEFDKVVDMRSDEASAAVLLGDEHVAFSWYCLFCLTVIPIGFHSTGESSIFWTLISPGEGKVIGGSKSTWAE